MALEHLPCNGKKLTKWSHQLRCPAASAETTYILSCSLRHGLQVLISGGSSAECAGPNSPASGLSYVINLEEVAQHFPLQEQMPSARVVGFNKA